MAQKKTSIWERLKSGKLNRKQRKELARRVYADDPGLEFGCWTADLTRMAEWLRSCGIETVVMQSTGVYWIAVYDALEKAGFKVWLANARDTKNLPGRKSDVPESQWLMKLHTYGLLRNSFRPPEQIRAVRTIWRLRDRNVRDAAREIQHMQKAMTTMNVQLANVLSDVAGVSGQAIIRAILAGQRDPQELAKLRDYRVKARPEEVARSLEGNWQEDILFELQQAVDRYDFCQQQIAKCDQQLEKYLAALPSGEKAAVKAPAAQAETADAQSPKPQPRKSKKKRSKPRRNEPRFDLEAELDRICGVNLTTLDGVYVMTVLTFVSELGTDMSPWRTEDHFVSWLKLAPSRQISGGKVIKQERNRTRNRVANALRMAASGLKDSDSYLGACFRQLRARLGPGKANKAMAAHLARLFYRILTNGQEWVDRGTQEHEKRRVEREKQFLIRKAASLGYRLEPAA
jgi:transposase